MNRVIDRAVGPLMLVVENLRCRWQDECEYEDWRDYEEALRAAAELHGMEFRGASQQPFGVRVRMRMVAPEVLVWSQGERNGWTIGGDK